MASAAASSETIATSRSRFLALSRLNPNLPCRGYESFCAVRRPAPLVWVTSRRDESHSAGWAWQM